MEIQLPPLKKIINESFIPLFHNRDRYLLLWGGRASSKSNFAAKKLIYRCLNEKYFRYILTRATYATIKDSQYQTIKDIIHEWGLQSLFQFKENPLEIKCSNGNIFYARGCDDVQKIKSIKDPSGVWYEEGNEIEKGDFITITTSIRTSKADYLQEIISFNPECDGDPQEFWIPKMFFKEREELSFSSNLEIQMPGGETLRTPYTVHHSTYKDNRWCDNTFKALVEQYKIDEPYYYDVYCLGVWGSKKNENPFFHQYKPKKHEATDKEIQNGVCVFNPARQIVMHVDFNIDPFAIGFSHIWEDKSGMHDHQFDELSIQNGSIPAMIDAILQRYGRWIQGSVLCGDSMGKRRDIGQRDNASNYRQLLRGLSMSDSQLKVPANPLQENSRADCNYVLLHHPDYKINPKTCPTTCRQMRTLEWDSRKGEIVKKNRKDIDQQGDFADGKRYAINVFYPQWIERHSKGIR